MQVNDVISLQSARVAAQIQRSTTPNPHSHESHTFPHQQIPHQSPPAFMRNWPASAQDLSNLYALNTQFPDSSYETFEAPYQTSPTNYMATNTQFDAGIGSGLDASLIMERSYLAIPSQLTQNHNLQHMTPMPTNLLNISTTTTDFVGSGTRHTLPEMTLDMNISQQFPEGSYYSDSFFEGLDVQSLSSSEAGWASIDRTSPHFGAITNPAQALHPRTYSDSSSEHEQPPANSWSTGGYVDAQPQAMSSPETESTGDIDFYTDQSRYQEIEQRSPPAVVTTAQVQPIAIRQSTGPQQRTSVSPVAGKKARKSPLSKASKTLVKVPAQNAKTDTDKKVGKRKGPLSADRRKQAGEIRKLGACLRCRYLKKTVSCSNHPKTLCLTFLSDWHS